MKYFARYLLTARCSPRASFARSAQPRKNLLGYAVVLLALTMAEGCGAPLAGAVTYTQSADNGVAKLQSWYSPNAGVWASPSGWWNDANALTVLTDYERIAADNSYYSAISSTFSNAPTAQGHPNFENNYYDDMGWWALAWIDAYDLTGNASYLSMAETIFSTMTGGWDTVCGGGLYWTTAKKEKNAIPNELFLEIAAKLANRTTGATSAGYLAWANNEWTWFKGSGLINSSNLINDGLTRGCTNNGGTEWTYNQGVILGGLAELYIADHDSTLLPQAASIANATITTLVNSNRVLVEKRVSGGDAPQFKGIFMRNLRALYAVAPSAAYHTFITNNVVSIVANDESTDTAFGALWQGPFDSADPTRQTSALDAVIAGIATHGASSTGPIEANGQSGLEMFATNSSGVVFHNWQSRGVKGASASSNWNGWSTFNMGNLVAKAGPAVAMNGLYQQTVFVPSSTGDIFYDSQTIGGAWAGWVDMGSTSNGLTGLHALNGLYGMTVFGLDSTGNVWFASKSTPGTAWSSFAEVAGKTFQAGYTVGRNESGNLEIFGVDGAGTVWTNSQTSSSAWSGWTSISGITVKPYLTVARNITGNLQIFAIDAGNTSVWSNWQISNGGSWQSSWQNLGNVGGGVTIQPGFVAGINEDGSLELFGVGNNGTTYTIWRQSNGNWTTSWTNLGGSSLNPLLTVGSTADGRIQVFAVSTTSPFNIYSNWETSQGAHSVWNGWASFSGGGNMFYPGQT